MKVRGERECQECGTRWSYYETGSVNCPSCGSVRSVGVDDRTRHTARRTALDLTPARDRLDDGEPLRRVAEEAADRCGEFTRGYGFIHAGELQPLSDTYLAAGELQQVAGELARAMQVGDDEAYYFRELLRGADHGERPALDEVPGSLRGARGLAYANAVREYRTDVRTYLDDNPDPTPGRVVERLGVHVKRVQALDGDVDPGTAERLVEVARELGAYLAGDDEGALARAEERLDRLSG